MLTELELAQDPFVAVRPTLVVQPTVGFVVRREHRTLPFLLQIRLVHVPFSRRAHFAAAIVAAVGDNFVGAADRSAFVWHFDSPHSGSMTDPAPRFAGSALRFGSAL